MKLITLNTHSLAEPDYERKLHTFAEIVEKEQPDILALQEVNQTISSPQVPVPQDTGYIPCQEDPDRPVVFRSDNHALRLAELLKDRSCPYYWTWMPVKIGYDIYEEGLALFSRRPIDRTCQFFISKSHSFDNWKTRKLVGIQADGQWFGSVHMGWWEDEEEPFSQHWDRAHRQMESLAGPGGTAWILGDFNSPAGLKGEGYDYVKDSGWQDTYEMAEKKDDGITVGHVIDGWKERLTPASDGKAGAEGGEAAVEDAPMGMRIDYIWCSRQIKVENSVVICNDKTYPAVSDHYGIMVTI